MMLPHHIAVADGTADAISEKGHACCNHDHDAKSIAYYGKAESEKCQRQAKADCRNPLVEQLLVFVFLNIRHERIFQESFAEPDDRIGFCSQGIDADCKRKEQNRFMENKRYDYGQNDKSLIGLHKRFWNGQEEP